MSAAQTKPAFGIFNGLAPEEMPKGLPYTYDFSTIGTQSFDLTLENTNGIIQMVQSVYVDNSDNLNALTLRFTITNQRLIIPAGAQGIWPVIAPLQTQITASTTVAANLRVQIILLNVPMPYTQWGPFTVNVTGVSVNTTAVASAAAPAYAPGAQPLSQDLTGNLRVVVAGGSTGVTAVAAAAPPTYAAGPQPLSQDLGGNLRTTYAASNTATKSNVPWNAAAQALLAANNARIGGSIINDTDGVMYILLGAGVASATNYSYSIDQRAGLTPGFVGGSFEIPQDWKGAISCFWSTGSTGAARVTERTA